jgi:hypothetical protein
MGQSKMPIQKHKLNFGGPPQLINIIHNVLPCLNNTKILLRILNFQYVLVGNYYELYYYDQ